MEQVHCRPAAPLPPTLADTRDTHFTSPLPPSASPVLQVDNVDADLEALLGDVRGRRGS